MKHNKAIFDLDGVLLDSETNLDWLDRALEKALEELDVPVTRENVEKLYPGGLQDFEISVKDFPVSPEKVWKTRDKYYIAEKQDMIEKGDLKPFPDVKSLHRLQSNYSLGVISNSPEEIVDQFIRVYNLEHLFEAWVGRASELKSLKEIKPDPFLFTRLKEEIGNGQFWYIGDREVDREFAENTGMHFLHLTRDGEGFENLDELVDCLLNLRE